MTQHETKHIAVACFGMGNRVAKRARCTCSRLCLPALRLLQIACSDASIPFARLSPSYSSSHQTPLWRSITITTTPAKHALPTVSPGPCSAKSITAPAPTCSLSPAWSFTKRSRSDPRPATAMSSQPPALSKTASNPKQIPGVSSATPSVSTTQAFFTNTNGGVRANSSTRNATPRNAQGAKPKHKAKSKASYRLVDEDAEAELASMQNPNGRRGQQSITHLMNFALPPRPQSYTHQFRHGGRRGERKNTTWGLGSGYHATDKAR